MTDVESVAPVTSPIASALRSQWLRAVVGLVIVTACFVWGLPAFASYQDVYNEVRPALETVSTGLVAALILVSVANLISPSVSQVAALPGLTLRQAVWADWATTAVTNLIPGGSALAIAVIWSMYRSFGRARAAIARSIVVTGVWDVMVKLATPLVALAWLSTQRTVSPTFIQAAALGGALFLVAAALLAVVLTGPATARRLGHIVDRLPMLTNGWPRRLESLRTDTIALLNERGWWLTWWTVAGHANLYLLLVLCLRVVGIEGQVLGWAPILAAFAFGRLVTAIPVTPGGLGVMEVGLTGALSAVAEAPTTALVAGVLLFRFLTFALPVVPGIVGLFWWNSRRPVAVADG